MEYNVVAYHLEKQLDLKQFREKSSLSLLKREYSYLLYQIAEKSFVYVKDYGSVVFLNCEEAIKSSVFADIVTDNQSFESFPEESYIIYEGGEKIEVDFGKIQVPNLTVDFAHIIMLNLAQSVALSNYVNATSILHDSTLTYSKQLEETGNIKVSSKKMQMFIGKTMNLKNSISENLYIFDSSDLAWSNENLSKLDYLLKDELDIVKRHQGLQFSLDVVKENLDLFKDILQHKYSSMLEWIIIILILFEVIQVIIEKI